jgi:lipopolysaccharide transport system ATP-binding protein
MASVRLNDVSFSYPVFGATDRSLKVSLMRQISRDREGGLVKVHALSQVSLHLKEGDRLGLVGRNGAGKSTLLKVLSRLIHPQLGRVKIEGRIVPLLAKGLGVQVELSGYRNIDLPMRLLGATEAEIRTAHQEVPEVSGLGDFMHLPVRTYSDGMRARLMFAICTAVRGDVLVMDEWLSAGDAEFVQRAQQRLKDLVSATPIVVLSSHSLEIIRSICNTVCWMEAGRIVMTGPCEVVLPAYLQGLKRQAPEVQP